MTQTLPRLPTQRQPDPPPADGWALVERCQAGDTEAFGELYDRYLPTVWRFVRTRIGSRQTCEDIVQITFLRALRRIGSVTWQGRDPGAWLVTIARNLVADHYKSGRYRLEIPCGEMVDHDRAAGVDPAEAVGDGVTRVMLRAAVACLNPQQRQCVELRFYRDLSVAETATAMDTTVGAVKALQYRAVRSLAQLLTTAEVTR